MAGLSTSNLLTGGEIDRTLLGLFSLWAVFVEVDQSLRWLSERTTETERVLHTQG